MIRFVIAFLTLLFLNVPIQAQNLTGTWEGMMDNGEKLQLNIKMKNNQLCGYSSDYVINEPSSHCKAIFKGWYDNDREEWILMGTSFLENSGSHILMLIRLATDSYAKNVLKGTVEAKSEALSMFNMGGGRDNVRLRKISSTLPADMPDCFPKIIKPGPSPVKKEATIKPLPKNIKPGIIRSTPQQPIAIPQKPVKPAIPARPAPTRVKPLIIAKDGLARDTLTHQKVDSIHKTTGVLPGPQVTMIPKTDIDLLRRMNERKKNEVSHLIVHQKNITLSVYDNGVVDNDTVSIFYNGKLIAGKKGLSEKPLVIKLELDENAPVHEIVMFAENLGSIPPNTALIVVNAGGKRYELHSSASMTENAVLTFEYKPE